MCGLCIYNINRLGKKKKEERISGGFLTGAAAAELNRRESLGGLPALRQVILVQLIMIPRQFNDPMWCSSMYCYCMHRKTHIVFSFHWLQGLLLR